jgi:hypothetical protein
MFKKGDQKPEGSGRRAGTPNKATATVRELLLKEGADPIAILADIAMGRAVKLGLVPEGSDQGCRRCA